MAFGHHPSPSCGAPAIHLTSLYHWSQYSLQYPSDPTLPPPPPPPRPPPLRSNQPHARLAPSWPTPTPTPKPPPPLCLATQHPRYHPQPTTTNTTGTTTNRKHGHARRGSVHPPRRTAIHRPRLTCLPVLHPGRGSRPRARLAGDGPGARRSIRCCRRLAHRGASACAHQRPGRRFGAR